MSTEHTYLVVIGADGKPVHGGSRQVEDVPGEWTAECAAEVCVSGWHACTPESLALWCYANRDEYLPIEVWECRVKNATYPSDDGKVVGTSRKRTHLLGTLDAVDLRWLAADIACQTLHLTADPRPGACILTVYEWCCGEAGDDDLRAASSAAAEAAEVAWAAAEAAEVAWAAWAASSAAASRTVSRVASEGGLEAASSRIVLDYLDAVRDEHEGSE